MLRKICLSIVLIGICVAISPAQQTGNSVPKKDEAAIKAVLAAFENAWNTHDMNKFAALFTADADWVNIRGARWVGIDKIKSEHVAVHDRFYSKSKFSFSDVKIRMLSKDVAVIHAKETVTGSDVPKQAGIADDSQLSLVVVRRGKKWLIANGHNTNVAPAPPPRQ